MVFTTKYHDGFCMFDSSYTDYKITNTPYGKDIVKQPATSEFLQYSQSEAGLQIELPPRPLLETMSVISIMLA